MDTQETSGGKAVGAQLAAAFNELADRALDPEATPLDRAAMITGLLKAIESRQKPLGDTRRKDMRDLRPSMTLAALGDAVDLSTGRIDQIVKGR